MCWVMAGSMRLFVFAMASSLHTDVYLCILSCCRGNAHNMLCALPYEVCVCVCVRARVCVYEKARVCVCVCVRVYAYVQNNHIRGRSSCPTRSTRTSLSRSEVFSTQRSLRRLTILTFHSGMAPTNSSICRSHHPKETYLFAKETCLDF